MGQLHRSFTDEQVKVLLQKYCQGKMRRANIQEILGIGKTRFFALLKTYRQAPETFSISLFVVQIYLNQYRSNQLIEC